MRNLFGLVVIIFGIGWLLQAFNVPGADRIISAWWPLAIVAVGIIAWASNPRHWFAPMLIVLFGAVLLFDDLGVLHQSAWNAFWPIVVILIGGRILMGRSWRGRTWDDRMTHDSGPADANVMFSGIDRKVTGEVQHSAISAWFGGVKLDMRDATFTDDATLAITAGFGGIELLVPKDVRIVSHISPILGGVDDKSAPDPNAKKTLTLTGSAMFGGVNIKN